MSQHHTELQSLRSIHQEEISRIEQAHLNKTAQQLNALREKMDNDREEACAKEREMMRAKYDKQLDEMEVIHTSKCQRMQVQHADASLLFQLLPVILMFLFLPRD